jgi:Bifunctional DNA primase/polymerase, N-terminal
MNEIIEISDAIKHRDAVIDAAVFYVLYGWAIFPAAPAVKKSHKSAKHSNGHRWGATRDPAEIRVDFMRWPRARIGIPTGVENGFIVLEIDTLKGHGVDGTAAMARLVTRYGPSPVTLTAISPSGSIHYYLRHPGRGIKIRNTASELGPGLNTRGDGGMVLAPPSFTPGRGHYTWANDLPIAQIPEWLVELTREKPRPISQRAAVHYPQCADRQLRGLVRFVAHAVQTQRNSSLYWASCRAGELVCDGTADRDFCFAVLLEAAMHAGLERNETERSIRSAFRQVGAL